MELKNIFTKEGCESCNSYEEKKDLSQEGNNKVLNKVHYCKLFKKKLKNTKPCGKFKLSYNVIRKAMSEK